MEGKLLGFSSLSFGFRWRKFHHQWRWHRHCICTDGVVAIFSCIYPGKLSDFSFLSAFFLKFALRDNIFKYHYYFITVTRFVFFSGSPIISLSSFFDALPKSPGFQLLCLIPYVTQLAQQAFHHQCENRSLRDELKSLHDELETVHSNALRQSAQMAEHVANLTEELQAIRARGLQFSGSVDRVGNDSGSISPHQSASSSCKKVSAEDSVKHCFHCIFYF